MLDGRIIELDHGEGFERRGERDLGPAFWPAIDNRGRPRDLQRRDHVAMGEFDEMLEPISPDAQDEARRQGIYDRNADAMQAAGNLIGVLIEFAARMQL